MKTELDATRRERALLRDLAGGSGGHGGADDISDLNQRINDLADRLSGVNVQLSTAKYSLQAHFDNVADRVRGQPGIVAPNSPSPPFDTANANRVLMKLDRMFRAVRDVLVDSWQGMEAVRFQRDLIRIDMNVRYIDAQLAAQAQYKVISRIESRIANARAAALEHTYRQRANSPVIAIRQRQVRGR